MREICLPRAFAELFGPEIEGVAAGELRLLPIAGDAPDDPDLTGTEIALQGRMDEDIPFDRVLARMPNVRWIHSTWAGVDEVGADEIARRGILFTNSAGAYAPGMTEYVLWALVELARGMPRLHEAQREARWDSPWQPSGMDLYGHRLGIVGYGEIGRHLARAAKGLGMEVWGTRRTPLLVTGEPLDRWLPAAALPELLAASDFVVVAASLNRSTRYLLGEAELAAMRPGALLVNIGRGPQIDEDALLAALRSGRIGGAVLDVMAEEPLPPSSPLWAEPNVVLTPHLSGDTPDAQARTVELFIANLRLYLAGRTDKLANPVHLED
jgi:phosphoglycerate dehydrogenase-like enzyme